MALKDLYIYDLTNRYPGYTFTETVIDSMTFVEFKDVSLDVVSTSKKLDIIDAYISIRTQLNISSSIDCAITTVQRDTLTVEKWASIINTDTNSVNLYNGSDWVDIGADGTIIPRLNAYLSTNLLFDTEDEEKIIEFDAMNTNYGIDLADGEIEFLSSGRYRGSLMFHINETGDPEFMVWIEIKPVATGTWVLLGGAVKAKFKDDTSFPLTPNGSVEVQLGDKIRVKGMQITGGPDTITLQSFTQSVLLGTLNQPSVTIDIIRVGDLTPV